MQQDEQAGAAIELENGNNPPTEQVSGVRCQGSYVKLSAY